MKTTGNLGLKKPDGTDIVDITDLNGNMDILDTAVKAVQDHAADTVKHITAAERTAWNAKASTSAATTSAAGLMAAADKSKLDSVAQGANNYSHPNHTGDVTSTGDGVTAIAAGVIVNADVNAAAAIDASKIGTGVVSNAEFGYLDGVTSGIQGQLNGKANLTTTPQQTTADITYYVRTDGNDGNTGLGNTAGGAFKTIAKAVSMIPQTVNHSVTINVAAGTYAEDVFIAGQTGGGYIAFVGSSAAIRSFTAARCLRLVVQGFTATTTTGAAFNAYDGGFISFSSCDITASASHPGFNIGGQDGEIQNCTVSNRNYVVFANAAKLWVVDMSGTGNATGLYSQGGSVIGKYGSQASATTPEAVLGAIITSGVFNPWGDNTYLSRSTMASGGGGANQSVSTNTWTKVQFSSEFIDYLDEYDRYTSRFTAKATGTYLVSSQIGFDTTGAATGVTHLRIYKSGTPDYIIGGGMNSISATMIVRGVQIIDLAAGQYLEVYVWTSIGAGIGISSSGHYTNLQITRIA